MNSHSAFRSFAYLSSLALLTSCGSDGATDAANTTSPGATSSSTSGAQTSATNGQTTNNQSNSVATTSNGPTGSSTSTGGTSTGASGTTNTSGATGGGATSQATTSPTSGGATSTAGNEQTTTADNGNSSAPDETSTGPDIDEGGKTSATPGTTTDVAQDYIRLGEIRILNNNWGSEEVCPNAGTQMSVFVDNDGKFGWTFNRQNCATDTSHPDFPQLEFGIHPFGNESDLVTSPKFSSTTLLPLQIKDIQTLTLKVDNLNTELQDSGSWNTAMEFWLSERDPREPNPGVYAEVMAWWGWNATRWPCDGNGSGVGIAAAPHADSNVSAGTLSYQLCHQSDTWADNKWRYFQFRAGDTSDGNSKTTFNGTIDIKAFLDYLKRRSPDTYPDTLWLTRVEIGTEIDNNTSGKVSMSGVTFNVNGQERSQVIGVP